MIAIDKEKIETEWALLIHCPKCENWLEMDEDQPRDQCEGNGFTFSYDTEKFTCECGNEANHQYEEKEN